MKENNDLDLTIQITALLQILIFIIDDLSSEVIYKQELKQRTNNYYNYIESFVTPITKELDIKQCDDYLGMIQELQKIISTLQLSRLTNNGN